MSTEETIEGFFAELDRRIRGMNGDTAEERVRLCRARPLLRRHADEDPEGFARRLRTGAILVRREPTE
jgi:hypothetical protein